MKLKLRNKIKIKVAMVFISAVTLILIVLSVIFNNIIKNEAIQQSIDLCDNTLENIKTTLDSRLMLANDYRYILHSDEEMMYALSQILPLDQRTNYKQYTFQNNIRKSLVNYSNTSSFIDSFFLYSCKGETFFSSLNKYFIINNISEDQCSLIQAYHKATAEKWIVYKDNEQGDEYHSLISGFQPIYDFNTKEKLGVYSININTKSIINDISTRIPEKDMNIIITDSFGAYVYPPVTTDPTIHKFIAEKNGSGHDIITLDSQEYLIMYNTSTYTKWKFYAILPLSTVLSSTTYVNNVVWWIYIFIIISFFITAFAGRIFFFKPISSIFNAMKQVESGDLSVQIQSQRKDEVGYIINRFNQTVSRLNNSVKENYINKLLLREAQLINVYSQIDEHFLYNTLDSIRWAASYCDPSKISKTVVMLSKYYRLCLADGKDIITIKDAIAQIEAYLQINKFRLQDNLRYTIDIDEATLNFLIIKYVLQPLVENCIVHGIGNDNQNGHIKVSIKLKSDVLHFTISDNGIGIERSILSDIKSTIAKSDTSKAKYFALHTVNLLLNTFYGEQYQLHIESTKGVGTTYWFEIPLLSALEGES